MYQLKIFDDRNNVCNTNIATSFTIQNDQWTNTSFQILYVLLMVEKLKNFPQELFCLKTPWLYLSAMKQFKKYTNL